MKIDELSREDLVKIIRELESTLQWYAGFHRGEDYLNDNGQRADKALQFLHKSIYSPPKPK